MVERNTDSEQSLIFLKESEVTRILWAWRSRETRDSCLASLPLHALRVGQRQDTLLLMRYKRFNGYLDFLNTFIYMVKICLEIYELMSVLFGTKCIWKKKEYWAKQKLSLELKIKFIWIAFVCISDGFRSTCLIYIGYASCWQVPQNGGQTWRLPKIR